MSVGNYFSSVWEKIRAKTEALAGSGQDEFWRYFGVESTRLHDQCNGGGKEEGGIWITARFLSWVSGLMDGEDRNPERKH